MDWISSLPLHNVVRSWVIDLCVVDWISSLPLHNLCLWRTCPRPVVDWISSLPLHNHGPNGARLVHVVDWISSLPLHNPSKESSQTSSLWIGYQVYLYTTIIAVFGIYSSCGLDIKSTFTQPYRLRRPSGRSCGLDIKSTFTQPLLDRLHERLVVDWISSLPLHNSFQGHHNTAPLWIGYQVYLYTTNQMK